MLIQPELANFARAFSRLLGWTYVICWSVSFYPQALLNWRRRSTQGFSIDFPTLNLLGFFSYTTSTAAFFFSSTIKRQYAERNPVSPVNTVRFNDFVFALHAFILCAITYSQFYQQVWHFPSNPPQRASPFVVAVIWTCLSAILCLIFFVSGQNGRGAIASGWAWIDIVYGFGYIKLICTIFKYIPQAYMNYRRKSTRGWSITAVLLDLSGSILSLLQLVIDSSLQEDWSGLVGNPAKFGLSNVGMVFACVFIFQHYVLYRPKAELHDEPSEESPLLPPLVATA